MLFMLLQMVFFTITTLFNPMHYFPFINNCNYKNCSVLSSTKLEPKNNRKKDRNAPMRSVLETKELQLYILLYFFVKNIRSCFKVNSNNEFYQRVVFVDFFTEIVLRF